MALARNLQLMFLLLFTGYMVIVYVRQSVSYAAPVIAESEKLENSDLGLIVSSQQLGYTFIKFLGGALVDIVDPGWTFVACLLLTGLTSAAFTAASTVSLFVVFWFLCGMAQGPAWSACAVLIKQYFPADQFATWWSILSTSSNVAGTAGPFVSQAIVSRYSWRASLLTAATSSLVLGVVCFLFLKTSRSSHSSVRNKTDNKVNKQDVKALFNPLLMLLCLHYLMVSIIRGAYNDWGQMYLIKNKKQSLLAGSSLISSLEIGGIVGSVVAGYLSDFLVSKTQSRAKPRLTIIAGLTVLQSLGIYLFIFHTHPHTSQLLTNMYSFMTGFGVYGIITLLGVASMETAPENLSGTAHSLATLGGNLGRVIAGYPLSLVATWFSWQECFLVVLLVSVASIAVSVLCVQLLPSKQVWEKESKHKV